MSEDGKQEAELPPLGVRMRGISIFLFPIVLVVVAADQYTKYLAERYLQPLEIIPVIDGVFNLTLHYNKGAAFGMFQGLPDGVREATLWGVSSVAVVVVLYFLFCEYYFNVWGKIALSLILGGAIGNAIDRASKGEVVDFLDFYLSQYHWPAFNVADSAICVGGGILLLLILFESKPKSVTRIP